MIMIILNVANNKYRSANLLMIVVGIGVVVAVLDTYLKPTRSKVLFYSISTVLLVLLWIALDQEWINPLMLI
jgi:flagellar biosynthesis/type III secretory pathway M-ring protein FliF/YscJ